MTLRNNVFMGKIRWCICHGPDASHLHNAEWHGLKRDALTRMPLLAMNGRAARLTRHEWRDAEAMDTKCDVKEVAFWHKDGCRPNT